MMIDLPFSALKYLHSNLTHLVSTNEDKIDILDTNRIPYAIKFNKEIENFFCVADENGYLKFFRSFPKLKPIKDIAAQKSCIYDIEWLNRNELACGGGDQTVSIYDVNTGARTSILKGHTESVKSLSQSTNPFVLASGSRDGTILVYDLRCNKNQSIVEQIDNFSNEVNQTVTYIRSINLLQFSSSTQSGMICGGRGGGVNILKSKIAATLNSSSPSALSSSKRSSPVSCVLFQNENLLASAGATDSLIKVWDIRKLSSIKKQVEATPVYMLENQTTTQQLLSATATKKNVSKGYTNLLFNSTKSLLYANCMNNFLYEFNFVTFNSNHTRSINHKLNNKSKATYHINTSNFIRSSISKCDNFLLTGSSDFNAYIYPTSVNNQFSRRFKHSIPAIVLKGHTNEVTAVQWNPLDSNQLVTCSDDNTIRIWNVKREIDDLTTKECNYSSACVLNEFENVEESNADEGSKSKELIENDDYVDDNYDDLLNYSSKIRSNQRMYNKYRPHITGVFDDYLFINYEYKNFMRKPVNKAIAEKLNSNSDFENELCMKCKKINFDKDDETIDILPSCSPSSHTSVILNSIEEDLKSSSCLFLSKNVQSKALPSVKKLGFLSNFPINIIKENESEESVKEISKDVSLSSCNVNSMSGFLLGRRQASSSNLLTSVSTETNSSTLTNIGNKKLKAKSIRQKPSKLTNSQKSFGLDLIKNPLTPKNSALTNTPNTNGKKRTARSSDSQDADVFNSENICIEPKTPQTKRRLIMPECINSSAASPSRTILHYFSPKPSN